MKTVLLKHSLSLEYLACWNGRMKGDPVHAALYEGPISAWFFCFVEPRKALGANWDRTRMSKRANWEESWSAVLLLLPSVQRSLFLPDQWIPQMNYTHLLRQPRYTSSSLFRIDRFGFFLRSVSVQILADSF